MDPNNPIVQLCIEGMRAEGGGRTAEAADLFMQAWSLCQNDFDACIAAHYLARHQPSAQETLRWNQLALTHAQAVGNERVQDFYPSLYLNLGWSHEQLGELSDANHYYLLAAEYVESLPNDRYGAIVRSGVSEGQRRMNATGKQSLEESE